MTTTGSTFPPEVEERLKFYVYRLIDPRNGETFYVGKGRGNRVFAHIREQVEGEPNEKLSRIRAIHLAGFEVAHVIHRHGMDEKTAFEVEAALMDAYPGLTNIAGGHGSDDFGAMHAQEIIHEYAAEPAVFEHKAILINVSRSAADSSLYEATPVRLEDWRVQGQAGRSRACHDSGSDRWCLCRRRMATSDERELPRSRTCAWSIRLRGKGRST